MSLVIPDGQVWLCSGVPFDANYDNTKWYTNKSAQFSEISSMSIFTAENCRYMRHNTAIRLTCPANKAYAVNYLIYKNTSFENKYFYAFVNSVRYINNDLFEFSFTIDVIQTWMFDYNLSQCFIEREHIANDELYASLTQEGLEYGEPYVNKEFKDSFSRSWKICVASTQVRNEGSESEGTETSYTLPTGKIYGKTYSGLHLQFFEGAAAANAYIKAFNDDGRIDDIQAVFMCPKAMGTSISTRIVYAIPFNKSLISGLSSSEEQFKEGVLFEGYVPKNKKLYNYPYRFIRVLNARGAAGVYRWEFNSQFMASGRTDEQMNFTEFIGGYNNPEILLSPQYNTYATGTDPNTAHLMTSGGFPQCSWSSDGYQSWLAQNWGQLNYSLSMIDLRLESSQAKVRNSGFSALANMALKTVSGKSDFSDFEDAVKFSDNIRNEGTSLYYDTQSAVQKLTAVFEDHKLLPAESSVISTSGQLSYDAGISGFTFQTLSIRRDYAEIIDNYFTMYGYMCQQVKTPNHYTRKAFNFIRTVGCLATGTCPADELKMIQQIYDKGIRFWHCNISDVGNYNLDNSSI